MILIALGANLPSRFGTPEDTLEAAKAELSRRDVSVIQSSNIWVTAPVPASDQPFYRNAVISVSTSLPPKPLLHLLKSLEAEFGRAAAERNAPRVLDLDLLAYGDQVIREGDLEIPHPRMHLRGFVLGPLREIAPDWSHPVLQKTAEKLFFDLPESTDPVTDRAKC